MQFEHKLNKLKNLLDEGVRVVDVNRNKKIIVKINKDIEKQEFVSSSN